MDAIPCSSASRPVLCPVGAADCLDALAGTRTPRRFHTAGCDSRYTAAPCAQLRFFVDHVAVFAADSSSGHLLKGAIDRIGHGDATLTVSDGAGGCDTTAIEAANHADAGVSLLDALGAAVPLPSVIGVGHRIVDGGAGRSGPLRIRDDLVADFRRISRFAPRTCRPRSI